MVTWNDIKWDLTQIIFWSIILGLAVGFMVGRAYGAEPELKCLVFQGDKLVVVQARYLQNYDLGGGSNCEGHVETISYFLYKGYNISAVSELEVYLTK